ncbi:MAG: HAMP domain-containing sensor histidine kinase [Planctomycetota bacterium]
MSAFIVAGAGSAILGSVFALDAMASALLLIGILVLVALVVSVLRPRPAPPPPAAEPDLHPRLGEMILKENLTLLGRLASGVAHEFGNPLTTISSTAQLLRRRRAEDEFVTEKVRVIEAHVQRLSRLSRQLVDMAFPRRPEVTVFDPHPAIRDTLQVARLDRRLRNMEIDVATAEPDLRVRSDEGALHMILANLLFNAADAMGGEGTITVTTGRSELGAEIRVVDRGPGIPEEIRSRIFAPFFTTKEAGEGTGIGLPVSCRLARAVGGELNLERSDAGGSTFLLLLDTPEPAETP